MKTNTIEVQRQVTLAMVLEPLPEKEGCTTRMKDLSKETSLYNFQTTAVNTGSYFHELAKRAEAAGGQPELFEDLFYQALSNSLRSINSVKFITYGLLELMFPFVVARLVTKGDGVSVCKAIPQILKSSSQKDAEYLDKTRSLAWSTSKKAYKKNFTEMVGGKNLYEHYSRNLVLAKEIDFKTSAIWIEQLLAGMPLLQKMYLEAKKAVQSKEPNLNYISRIYKMAETEFPSQGARADYTGIVLYLLIAESLDSPIVF